MNCNQKKIREKIYKLIFDKIYIDLNQSGIGKKGVDIDKLAHDLLNKPSDLVIRNYNCKIKLNNIMCLIRYANETKYDTALEVLNKISYERPTLKEYIQIIIEALKNHVKPDFLMIKYDDILDLSYEMFENFYQFDRELGNTGLKLIEVSKKDRHIFKKKIMGTARYFILKSFSKEDVKVIIGPYDIPIIYDFSK